MVERDLPGEQGRGQVLSDAQALIGDIMRDFGLKVDSLTPIGLGERSDALCAAASTDRYFVKVLREPGQAGDLAGELWMSAFVAARGVRAARPVAVRDNPWLVGWHCGRPYSMWSWIPGSVALQGWSKREAIAAGSQLGLIHSVLEPLSARPHSDEAAMWLAETPAASKRRLCDAITLVARSEQVRGEAGDQARDHKTIESLELRLEVLEYLEQFWELWSEQPVCMVHGDFCTMNVLVAHNDVTGIVDFSPPTSHLRCYEVGRAAYDARTVTGGDDWMERSLGFLSAYRAAHPDITAEELKMSSRAALLQLARSTYGLEDRYIAGAARPSMDAMWDTRTRAVRVLYRALAHLDDALAASGSTRS